MTLTIESIKGQKRAKTALLIAATGRHNLLLIGPPGEGKTALLSTIPSVLPSLSRFQYAEVAQLFASQGRSYITRQPPFREVHHSVSKTGLVGGYSQAQKRIVPGEITLAHNGILFLDELAEWDRSLLDLLRQPMEERAITVVRSGQSVSYPCDFQLVAATNPCKCGYWPSRECTCSPGTVDAYQRRLSGPIMDRIDIVVWMYNLSSSDILSPERSNGQSDYFRKMISHCHISRGSRDNYRLTLEDLKGFSTRAAFTYIAGCKDKIERFSTRRMVRTLRVAKSISDLRGAYVISEDHIREALTFTKGDLKYETNSD